MIRQAIFLLTIFLPVKAWAACPELALIKESIKEIRDRLTKNSEEPIDINGIKYIVRHGKDGKSVDDLLTGNFQGYILDRFKETTPGVCRYRGRDNRSPVMGHFVLFQQQ